MSDYENLLEKHEKETQALRNKIAALRGRAGWWEFMARMIMSDNPSESDFGKRLYKAAITPK